MGARPAIFRIDSYHPLYGLWPADQQTKAKSAAQAEQPRDALKIVQASGDAITAIR
jgi:hypothetical protein